MVVENDESKRSKEEACEKGVNRKRHGVRSHLVECAAETPLEGVFGSTCWN